MGKGFRKFVGFMFGTAAAWSFAVKPRVWDKPDMSEIRRYDYAKRGFFNPKRGIPENSLAAFDEAVAHGYGMTMDVRLSLDGVPVVFHDEHLYRMTQRDGEVENLTLRELQEYRLGNTEEGIPALADALKLVDGQVPVLIGLRTCGDNVEELCDAVCEVLDAYEGVFAVFSVDPRVLRWFRRERNEYIRGQVVDYSYCSGYTITSRIWDLFCSSLLLNFLTEPDMLVCSMSVKYNPSVWLCRVLYQVPRLYWTVRSIEEYEAVKTDGAAAVFEAVEP